MKRNDYSAWHRLKSDEIWHFFKGAPLKIHVLENNGSLVTHILGDPLDMQTAEFQVIIKANNWFAAELLDKNSYCLAGCTVSPGFEFNDFELAEESDLTEQFSQLKEIISKLVHKDFKEENSDDRNLRVAFKR